MSKGLLTNESLVEELRIQSAEVDAADIRGSVAIGRWIIEASLSGDSELADRLRVDFDAVAAEWDRQRDAEDNAERLAELRDAIDAVRGHWVDADWTHEVEVDGERVLDEHDRPRYCDGTSECDVCNLAENDAVIAESRADDALRAIFAGDLARAAECVELAAEIERKYGDATTWGPVAKLARKLAEKGGES